MLTHEDFFQAFQWAGLLTMLCALLTGLGFLLKWGVRFRLVGITGFMGVLTGGLFALGLVPFTRTVIPGAVQYSLVFDDGAAQMVIAVPPSITEPELEATLRQAASNLLFNHGRLGSTQGKPTVRARTILHPQAGVSQPVYLGQAQRSADPTPDPFQIEIFADQLAILPKVNASQSKA